MLSRTLVSAGDEAPTGLPLCFPALNLFLATRLSSGALKIVIVVPSVLPRSARLTFSRWRLGGCADGGESIVHLPGHIATISLTPHHPKVVVLLEVPFPLSKSESADRMSATKSAVRFSYHISLLHQHTSLANTDHLALDSIVNVVLDEGNHTSYCTPRTQETTEYVDAYVYPS